jgi:hypothetical protein
MASPTHSAHDLTSTSTIVASMNLSPNKMMSLYNLSSPPTPEDIKAACTLEDMRRGLLNHKPTPSQTALPPPEAAPIVTPPATDEEDVPGPSNHPSAARETPARRVSARPKMPATRSRVATGRVTRRLRSPSFTPQPERHHRDRFNGVSKQREGPQFGAALKEFFNGRRDASSKEAWGAFTDAILPSTNKLPDCPDDYLAEVSTELYRNPDSFIVSSLTYLSRVPGTRKQSLEQELTSIPGQGQYQELAPLRGALVPMAQDVG